MYLVLFTRVANTATRPYRALIKSPLIGILKIFYNGKSSEFSYNFANDDNALYFVGSLTSDSNTLQLSKSNEPNLSKKEEFRKYLEKTGVMNALIQTLVGLYEEPERPPNPLDYVRRYLGAPSAVDVDGLKRENEDLKAQIKRLEKQIADRKS